MALNFSLALTSSCIARKSKEQHQAKLNHAIRTVFLRRDLDNLSMILKAQRIRKVLNLISSSVLDLGNLSCTLTSKETLQLCYHKISLVVIFKNLSKFRS